MSYLIDTFKGTDCEIKGKWWIAKPILNPSIQMKLKWIIEIIKGKAIPVHFKEDEENLEVIDVEKIKFRKIDLVKGKKKEIVWKEYAR